LRRERKPKTPQGTEGIKRQKKTGTGQEKKGPAMEDEKRLNLYDKL